MKTGQPSDSNSCVTFTASTTVHTLLILLSPSFFHTQSTHRKKNSLVKSVWVFLRMARRRRRRRLNLLAETSDNGRDSHGEPDEEQTRSDLPTELLELVLSKLDLEDNVRASAVCKRWFAVAASVRRANKSPWLMFFPKSRKSYELYDPSQRKTYWLELPELHGAIICYAREGWLLMFKPKMQSIFLFCPYTKELVKFPGLQLAYQIVAFSAAPTSPSCVLFTVRHVRPSVVEISTCRPGDKKWITVNYQNNVPFDCSLWDKIVFSKGHFYCLSFSSCLGVYDPDKSTWTVHAVPTAGSPENFFYKNWRKGKFMAEHEGDIFVIYTCCDENPRIYKLDEMNMVWVEMETLGSLTIFASFLSSYVKSDLLGMMRNNVYFSKVRYYGKRCISYSLDEGRYFPRKQFYDWEEQNPFECIWIDAPQDLSVIYTRRANNI